MRLIYVLFGIVILIIKKIRYSKVASESRIASFRISGAKIGVGVTIRPGVKISNCKGVTIEDGCYLGENTIISATDSRVKIGTNTLIAPNNMVVARTHVICNKEPIKNSGYVAKPIVIENDCWIGAGCIVLSGVTIGEGAVIAAGTVVNKRVSDFSIAGGVPVREIRTRT